MPEKNIPDIIQDILNKNKGFVNVKNLPSLISPELRLELGIKNGLTGPVIRKKLEPLLEDKFMFHKKGAVLYILTPCEPSELVISVINSSKSASPKLIAKSLPFTKKEFLDIINSLIDEGRAKLILNENLDVRIIFTEKKSAPLTSSTPEAKPYDEGKVRDSGDYSPRKFREAFDALDKGRIFVRICDLRRSLNWPREVFDDIIKKLRDNENVFIYEADQSTLTQDEIQDCFIDENNYVMGRIAWNAGE